MGVRKDKYRITWNTYGDRGKEEPLEVVAHVYRAQGEFFAFYSQNPDYDSPMLVIRASDVREIKRVVDDDA